MAYRPDPREEWVPTTPQSIYGQRAFELQDFAAPRDEYDQLVRPVRKVGKAQVDDIGAPQSLSKRPNNTEEQKRERRRVYTYLGILTAAVIILFLLLTGGWLFAALYNDHELGEVKHHLEHEIHRDFANLNYTLMVDFLYLNNTIASLGAVYVGSTVPPSTLGNPMSLYIQNNTNTMYYKINNTTWSLVLNATCVNSAPVCLFNVTDGVTYAGPWNSTVTYLNGTIVVYNNFLYITNTQNTNVIPSSNNTIWTILLTNITGPVGPVGPTGATGPPGQPMVFAGTWNNATNYTNGEVVVYNNSLYIVLQNNTNDPPPGDPSSWTLFLSNITCPVGPVGPKGDTGPAGTSILFEGNYNSSDPYDTGNVVVYNNAVYISLIPNNTNVSPTNSSAWFPLIYNITGAAGANGTNGVDGSSILYAGTWNNASTYVLGNVVLSNNSLYITNQTNTNAPPASSPGVWTPIFTLVPGATGPAGLNGTNGADGVGISFLGNWNASQSYTLDNLVIYNGTAFLALANNTNVTPGSNNATWAQFSFCLPGLQGPPGANGTDGVGVMFVNFWNASTTYTQSNIVIFNNSLYIAYAGSTGSTPSNVSMIWALIATGLAGPIGPVGPAGINGTNGNSVQFYGNWSSIPTYPQGAIVLYNSTVYIAFGPNTNVVPPSNSSVWTPIASSIPGGTGPMGINGTNGANGTSALFEGYWNATVAYPGSSIVIANNSLYISFSPSTGVDPSSNPGTWALIATNLTGPAGPQGPMGLNGTDAVTNVVYEGAWNATQPYLAGNVVLYNNSVYIAFLPNTNAVPTSNTSAWNFVFGSLTCPVGPAGPPGTNGTDGTSVSFVGYWNSTATFQQNNVVLFNGSLWVAAAASTNQEPDLYNGTTWFQIQSIVGPTGPMGLPGTSMGFDGTWNATVFYPQSQLVIYNSTLYVSAMANTGITPGTNSSVWTTILPAINCTQGPQGATGPQGTGVGANTIRVQVQSTVVAFSMVLTPYVVSMAGQYIAGPSDSTLGQRWGYYPLLNNQTAGITNLKTQFAWNLLFRTNTTVQNYLRIDMTGTPVGGGAPVTTTVCTTAGFLFSTPNMTASCGTFPVTVAYYFNYLLQSTVTGANVTCTSSQLGADAIFSNGVTNINPSNTYSYTPTTIDLTQTYYFTFVAANYLVADPTNCCSPAIQCSAEGFLGTTTNEFLLGSAN